MTSAIVQSIQITGISIELDVPIDHSVLIKLTVDAKDSRPVELKEKEMPVGVHSLHPPLYLRQGSVLYIHIEEKHGGEGDQALAQLLSPAAIWLASSQSMPNDRIKYFPIRLKDPKKRIWMNVVELPPTPSPDTSGSDQDLHVPENVSHAQEEVEVPLAAIQNVVQKLEDFKMVLERLGGDKHTVELVKFRGIVCELRLSSKAVFDSVNAFYEQIETQSESDQELLALAMNMDRTVNLIQPVKDIAKLNKLKKPWEMFPDLMTKTVDLIETWAKQSVLVNIVSWQPNKDKIDALNKHYAIFEQDFCRGIQIDPVVNEDSFLNREELKELKDILLDGIKTVSPKAIPCIPGTRTAILEEVETKIDDHDGTNIFWIRGAPGSGKSALSLSAKDRLRRQGRIVIYYRFDRNESTTTTAIAMWRHIAYNLACRFPAVCTHILHQLRDTNFEFDSPMNVFTSLVETPLSELVDFPINWSLIVIDALDECGGHDGRFSSERKELLQTLRHWPKLPKHFKLLVTSREESDISRALSTITTPIHIPSGTFLIDNPQASASIVASEDIRTFLEYRFSEIRTQLNDDGDWPGTKMIGGMVHRAFGNFMWATAAANFIEKGVNPEDRLHMIMSDASPSSSMDPLYSLYCTILETAFGEANDSEVEILRAVLGTIICAKRTLSDSEYIKLPTQDPISSRTLASVRNSLGSVIVTDGNLRFVHKSFDDFLRSPQCPPKYAVNTDTSHHLLTNLCLKTMENGLRFNLCDLETSCLKNTDVPDIEVKVTNGVPTLLSYSCCFWADHLSLAPSDQRLMNEVKAMVLDKLLYWFEAMSLLKEINRVSPSLLLVLKWFHSSPDDEFKEFLSDARQFIAAFGSPIAQSAPHIYISALPFAPENSSVARHYLPRFPRVLALTVGKPTDWPPCIFSLKLTDDHDYIDSVTLSPDEQCILSKSRNGRIIFSDFETGNLISGPFKAGIVSRVFFDPDGRYFWAASYSDKLIGFDVKTGKKHHDFRIPRTIGCCRCNGDQNIISVEVCMVTLRSADTGRWLRDLSMGISSWAHLTTLSPNGCRIACITFDDRQTVGIWGLVDGSEIQLVRGPSIGHPQARSSAEISALSFSVDSNFVVGGSADGTVLIWDAGTGDVVDAPLSTGSVRVRAVAYSHEQRRLISLDNNGAATVWNTATGEAVLIPLNKFTSIALSRDGRRAFLGTYKGEVTKWDLDRKGNVPAAQPNDCCTDRVGYVAFSTCGKKLASVHNQAEIRFWDARSCEPLPGRITLPSNHSRFVLSPDWSRVMLYDFYPRDNCVQLNVNTGELVHRTNSDSRKYYSPDYVAFRSDQWLVGCSMCGDVYLWNLEDSPHPLIVGELPRILALSPDGLTLIVCDDNRTPRHYMWSTITYRPLPLTFTNDRHVEGNTNAYYSSTGPLLAVTSYKPNSNGPSQSTLRVWNTQTGDLTAGPSTIHDEICQLVFSPDNYHIAFSLKSDRTTIWIWDARTGGIISAFWTRYASHITVLDFSPDGEKLVSGSADGEIRVWNFADLLGSTLVPAEFMQGGMDIQDGWVIAAGEKLGFWIPPDHREELVWNGNVTVLGGMRRGAIIRLDLTRFRYGEKWAECFGEAK